MAVGSTNVPSSSSAHAAAATLGKMQAAGRGTRLADGRNGKSSTRGARLSRVLFGNDSWEVFEGIPKHFSLRVRVRMKLKFSSLGVAWEFFQTAFALVVSALYVLQTYNPAMNTDSFDLTAIVVFAADYLLNFYCCENRCEACVPSMCGDVSPKFS